MVDDVVHFEIGALNAGRLTDFYRDLFGWEFDETDPAYPVVNRTGADGIGGGIMQLPEDVPPYVTVYVSVDDLGATLRRAADLGAKTVIEPMKIRDIGEFAMVTDPEGHVLGLFAAATRATARRHRAGV